MKNTKMQENKIFFTHAGELVRITPCGKNAIRFTAFPAGRVDDENFTLLPQNAPAEIAQTEKYVEMTVGCLTLRMYHDGKVFFFRDGEKILEELPEYAFENGIREYESLQSGLWRARVTFCASENEHFFGLGHDQRRRWDLKGCSFDLRNLNTQCAVPFVYSSLGYGFLWNNPSTGTVAFSDNHTRWTNDCTRRVDYVVIGGSPKGVAETLADLTGHAPEMPHWATGFWQSRLRYETQEQLLEVARRYKRENIPLAAIVADYFHWTEQGDYRFDPQYWPDVPAMTEELHKLGTKLVVSVWPTVNENSENYEMMRDRNLLVRTTRGSDRVFRFYGWQALVDSTNPETREFVFGKLRENYLDKGVDSLWLDESEPELYPVHFDNLLYYAGRGDEVALLYPYCHVQMAYDGYRAMGKDDIITLTRCAYLGSQKFGALVWSGDIPSTFESLACQVRAGLHMSLCGIVWWNTDLGGFYGGDTTSEAFRELIVRWFQYGVFCPVMRVHGNRERHIASKMRFEPSGDPNELWSFGEENFKILKSLVLLRERLRPYIEKHMHVASEKGWPVMRPMFFDFPEDPVCWVLDEQYMFGDDILFAPVVTAGQTEKDVYLPAGEWVHTATGKVYSSGFHRIAVPLSQFAAFVRKGAEVLEAFSGTPET